MNKDEIAELVKNKALHIKQKKANMKVADGVYIKDTSTIETVKKKSTNKNQVEATVVINTTNLFDSHDDVHINGLWNKSLKETRGLIHLQEHQMSFDKVISDGDDLKAHTVKVTWAELGYDFEGSSEALIFDSTIKRDRNEFMMLQYNAGNVKNHSVGMQYVKMELAVNDKDYKDELATWDKYYDRIANKSDVDEAGYFWAITEAKVIEGSAVLSGSNWATPTLEVKNIEPGQPTRNKYEAMFNEPSTGTQFTGEEIDNIYKQLKF